MEEKETCYYCEKEFDTDDMELIVYLDSIDEYWTCKPCYLKHEIFE